MDPTQFFYYYDDMNIEIVNDQTKEKEDTILDDNAIDSRNGSASEINREDLHDPKSLNDSSLIIDSLTMKSHISRLESLLNELQFNKYNNNSHPESDVHSNLQHEVPKQNFRSDDFNCNKMIGQFGSEIQIHEQLEKLNAQMRQLRVEESQLELNGSSRDGEANFIKLPITSTLSNFKEKLSSIDINASDNIPRIPDSTFVSTLSQYSQNLTQKQTSEKFPRHVRGNQNLNLESDSPIIPLHKKVLSELLTHVKSSHKLILTDSNDNIEEPFSHDEEIKSLIRESNRLLSQELDGILTRRNRNDDHTNEEGRKTEIVETAIHTTLQHVKTNPLNLQFFANQDLSQFNLNENIDTQNAFINPIDSIDRKQKSSIDHSTPLHSNQISNTFKHNIYEGIQNFSEVSKSSESEIVHSKCNSEDDEITNDIESFSSSYSQMNRSIIDIIDDMDRTTERIRNISRSTSPRSYSKSSIYHNYGHITSSSRVVSPSKTPTHSYPFLRHSPSSRSSSPLRQSELLEYKSNRSQSPSSRRSSIKQIERKKIAKSTTFLPYSDVRHLQDRSKLPTYNHSTIHWILDLCSDKKMRDPPKGTNIKPKKVSWVGLSSNGRSDKKLFAK